MPVFHCSFPMLGGMGDDMDAVTSAGAAGESRGIRFTGNWREYLPIAITNALLTICTLGIYRFWAAARQRRYLWSRTVFIDDTLEWTGTGKEMFVGFLIVMCVLAPFFLVFQFVLPALMAHGQVAAAFAILAVFYLAILYLGGFARFRALRYRLSRTLWHGIRGGSDDPGWSYGGEYLGRIFLSAMTMLDRLAVDGGAAVERPLEQDELRAAGVRIRAGGRGARLALGACLSRADWGSDTWRLASSAELAH